MTGERARRGAAGLRVAGPAPRLGAFLRGTGLRGIRCRFALHHEGRLELKSVGLEERAEDSGRLNLVKKVKDRAKKDRR
ncbi:uncharacterized protein METZ01_LOCUS510273 [marine metagenome]|uniref:Uncharacterized protein n=1 Tax=marine metagenome TaxID=408172 RepID=A0A383ELC0_9ZZZZ